MNEKAVFGKFSEFSHNSDVERYYPGAGKTETIQALNTTNGR